MFPACRYMRVCMWNQWFGSQRSRRDCTFLFNEYVSSYIWSRVVYNCRRRGEEVKPKGKRHKFIERIGTPHRISPIWHYYYILHCSRCVQRSHYSLGCCLVKFPVCAVRVPWFWIWVREQSIQGGKENLTCWEDILRIIGGNSYRTLFPPLLL